ncbi:hypothetical protein [Streptomyces sp. AC512_CC834]|uniref:hypothetical protein n=1 Tax=Streptomyces sp. AC512_CC834 TaxID=2823691 RepID=UPI001C25C4E6|nr:hypothetical protein [Streptomyces sp. AC512_CC834]
MRRHTGAAGIAVAIAAIVPLADTAHAEGPEPRSTIHQEAAQSAFATDPGTPEPLSPDALYQDSPDEGLLEPGGAGQGAYEEDALGQGEFNPDMYDQGGSGQGGFEQDESGQGGFEQGGSEQGGSEQGGLDDGRLDEARPDGDGLGQTRPDGGRPEQGGLDAGRPGQGVLDAGRPGQGVLDERREPYVGAVGGVGAVAAAPQHWASDPTISATSKPRPAPTTPAPAATTPAPTASPTVMPTLGTQGGVGGASATGPSGEDIAIGLGGVASAALAAGYALLRRRRNG